MKWTVTTPAAGDVLSLEQVKAHLRIDATDDRADLLDKIAAATAAIEDALATSLLERTITAVYYDGDELYLPRGPVTGIVSVTDGDNVAVDSADYRLEAYGNADVLQLLSSATRPLTVVYTAGYASADAIPAMVRHVILCTAGLLYEQRELNVQDVLHTIPHLESFTRMYSRAAGVG